MLLVLCCILLHSCSSPARPATEACLQLISRHLELIAPCARFLQIGPQAWQGLALPGQHLQPR